MTHTDERDVTAKPANVLMGAGTGFAIMAALGIAFLLLAWYGWSTGGFTMFACFVLATLVGVANLFVLGGFVTVQPYERLVVSFFGRYVGVERTEGLSWYFPLYSLKKVSTALQNFESETIKVNDHSGNPINLSAVIVHRVSDPAKAVYRVGNVDDYVEQQVVGAMRSLAAEYDYDDIAPKTALKGTDQEDAAETTAITLRGNIEQVAAQLKVMVQERIGDIGIDVVEARIVNLSYSSEIAAAMLKRQQAVALLAAREAIVEGAVGIVDKAMEQLKEKGYQLDEDRRGTLAGNLLVVLASDREVSPVMPLGMA
jgi:regulator of protease activity HflC (stomatin/prohibitin superfamily)